MPNSNNMTALLARQSQADAQCQKFPELMIASQLASRTCEQDHVSTTRLHVGSSLQVKISKRQTQAGATIADRVKQCLQLLHQSFAEPSEQALYSTTAC